jgi:hypothetical protein
MSSRGAWSRKAAWLTLLGGTGCASVFGFDYPQGTCTGDDSNCAPAGSPCGSASDCASGTTCSQGTCVSNALDGGGAADAAPAEDAAIVEAADESTPVTVDGAGAADQDAADPCEVSPGVTVCGACASACQWGVCVQDTCQPPTEIFPIGYDKPMPSGLDSYVQLVGPGNGDAGSGQLVGQAIHPNAGVLVGFGILAEYAGTNVYAGLYTSNNQQPGTLVAASSEFSTEGATPPSPGNPVQTTIAVPPTVVDGNDYWIVTMWQSDDFVAVEFPESECSPSSGQNCLATYSLYGPPFGPPPSVAQDESSLSDLHQTPPLGIFALVIQFQP